MTRAADGARSASGPARASDPAAGLDLAPLERAAARAGLPPLRARLVPRGRRRDRWFRWDGEALEVSERVVERCAPADAEALLVQAVLEADAVRGPRMAFGAAAGGLGALAVVALSAGDVALGGGLAVALLLLGCVWLAVRMRLVLRADDATVARLGDPVPLVRALNGMDQDELRLGARRLPARPDLHRRAERLAGLHQLCDAAGMLGAGVGPDAAPGVRADG